MDATATAPVLRAFDELPDPRTGRHVRHKLSDPIAIALPAVIYGPDGWAHVRQWAGAKHPWLATFLELPGGLPSHDTFGRVFARLDPDAFGRCFAAWMGSVVDLAGGRLVAIDGPVQLRSGPIRRSFAHGWDRSGMAHLVGTFVCPGRTGLTSASWPWPTRSTRSSPSRSRWRCWT